MAARDHSITYVLVLISERIVLGDISRPFDPDRSSRKGVKRNSDIWPFGVESIYVKIGLRVLKESKRCPAVNRSTGLDVGIESPSSLGKRCAINPEPSFDSGIQTFSKEDFKIHLIISNKFIQRYVQ